jgi:hypothetical protein
MGEDGAHAVDVACRTPVGAGGERGVLGRLGEGLAGRSGEVQAAEDRPAVRGEEDVVGADGSVDQAAVVEVRHQRGESGGAGERLPEIAGGAARGVALAHPRREQLRAGDVADQPHHAGVPEGGEHGRLPVEPLRLLRVTGELHRHQGIVPCRLRTRPAARPAACRAVPVRGRPDHHPFAHVRDAT